jgi:hypothetical protein
MGMGEMTVWPGSSLLHILNSILMRARLAGERATA